MSDQPHDSDGTTVADAARVLGISEGAVRKRVERGKLSAERTPDGRLLVFLDAATTDATRRTTDRDRHEAIVTPAAWRIRSSTYAGSSNAATRSCENTADCWPASSSAYPSWRPQ